MMHNQPEFKNDIQLADQLLRLDLKLGKNNTSIYALTLNDRGELIDFKFINFFEMLGVSEKDDNDIIKKKYRACQLKWHPDKNSGNKEEAEKKIRESNNAYEILADSEARDTYVKELGSYQNYRAILKKRTVNPSSVEKSKGDSLLAPGGLLTPSDKHLQVIMDRRKLTSYQGMDLYYWYRDQINKLPVLLAKFIPASEGTNLPSLITEEKDLSFKAKVELLSMLFTQTPYRYQAYRKEFLQNEEFIDCLAKNNLYYFLWLLYSEECGTPWKLRDKCEKIILEGSVKLNSNLHRLYLLDQMYELFQKKMINTLQFIGFIKNAINAQLSNDTIFIFLNEIEQKLGGTSFYKEFDNYILELAKNRILRLEADSPKHYRDSSSQSFLGAYKPGGFGFFATPATQIYDEIVANGAKQQKKTINKIKDREKALDDLINKKSLGRTR